MWNRVKCSRAVGQKEVLCVSVQYSAVEWDRVKLNAVELGIVWQSEIECEE